MKYPNVFKLVSSEFNQAGVPFLLVGGFAVNAHQVSRSTRDIDFLIAEEDYPKVLPLREDVCARLKSDELFFIDVDILFVDRETLDEMLKEAKEVAVRGEKFKVPSLGHLIAMKLHALKNSEGEREYKDLLDIMELIHKNRVDIDSDKFRDLFLKYGTEELYLKIKELKRR